PWQEPIAEEFTYMVKFGMSPMAAIQAATSRPAEMLGEQGMAGVVDARAFADLIAVAGNPLANIEELKKVKFVMKGGAVVKDEFQAAPCGEKTK
ncbi:MAG TPA: amidohydrolase family protein, partial [Terriglobales bacterium]|nr:amidohydrolase family protein [Terriglobales bacterium]